MIDRMIIGEHSIPVYGDELIWDDDNSIKGRYAVLVHARLLCNQEQLRVLKHAQKKSKRVGLASLSINVSLHEDMLTMTRLVSVQGVNKTMVTLYRPKAEGIGSDHYYFVAGIDAALPAAFVDFVEIATPYPAPAAELLAADVVKRTVMEHGTTIRQVIPDDGYYKGYRTIWSGRIWNSADDRKHSRLLTGRFSDKQLRAALEQLKQQEIPATASDVDTHQTNLPATTLLTPEIRKMLSPLKGTERIADPTVRVKFFTPDSSWTWWPLEFDGDDTFFGLVDSGSGQGKSLGYFSLSDLEDTQAGSLGLPIERDLHFTPRPLSELYPGLFE